MRFPALRQRRCALAVLAIGTGAVLSGCHQGTAQPETPAAVLETVPPAAPAEPERPAAAPGSAPPAGPATPVASPSAPPAEEEGPPVVLREDGLTDTLRFGSNPDEVIAGLTLRWGPPQADTGWGPTDGPPQPFGRNCPGGRFRAVSWGGFYVLFSDGPSPHGPAGRPHFFSWVYLADNLDAPGPDPGGNRPPLATAAGISVGATVAGLQTAYGERLNLYDEHTEEGVATGGPGFGAGGMFGSLTSLDPAGRVSRIVGGGGCTP